MKCPYCLSDNDRVLDSRASQDGFAIRRRRECLGCNRRYTTYERIEATTVKIIKKDNTREPFDHAKIKRGLEKACWKRPISDEQLEAVIAAVENEIEANFESEVESRHVGELVMQHLRVARRGGLRPFRQRLSPIQGRAGLRRGTAAHARRIAAVGVGTQGDWETRRRETGRREEAGRAISTGSFRHVASCPRRGHSSPCLPVSLSPSLPLSLFPSLLSSIGCNRTGVLLAWLSASRC